MTAPKLSDPIYDNTLVARRIRNIRSKLIPKDRQQDNNNVEPSSTSFRDRGGITVDPGEPLPNRSRMDRIAAAELNADGLSNLASTTKDIADVLERMENNRRTEQRKKDSDKSFLRNLGTMQRELFSKICTDELGELPDHPRFLKSLMDTKTPQKAIAMIRSEIWEWEGSFFDGPFHRFLANGYLSRDGNKGTPGGFTLFMFCPKNVEASMNTSKADVALLRDYFGLDVDDDTVSHYARQGWFYPSNHYDLRVQLKAARDMIDLLAGENSIASHGLSHILHPKRWDRYAPLLAERFKTENLFGAKFVYCLDRNLQVFFSKVAKWDPDDEDPTVANYLRTKAESLLGRIDDGSIMGTILPPIIYGPAAGAKRAIEQDPQESGDTQTNKKGRLGSGGTNKHQQGRASYGTPLMTAALLDSAEMTNGNTVSEWVLPKGTQYHEYFLSKDRSTRGWPMLDDPRLTSGSAPMCIRFQATGKCREACRMAHITVDAMSGDHKKKIGDRFREAYQSRGGSSS